MANDWYCTVKYTHNVRPNILYVALKCVGIIFGFGDSTRIKKKYRCRHQIVDLKNREVRLNLKCVGIILALATVLEYRYRHQIVKLKNHVVHLNLTNSLLHHKTTHVTTHQRSFWEEISKGSIWNKQVTYSQEITRLRRVRSLLSRQRLQLLPPCICERTKTEVS